MRVPYDEAVDPAAVQHALDAAAPSAGRAGPLRDSVGVENPLAEIGPIAHKHGALMFADVVSSLGGTPV